MALKLGAATYTYLFACTFDEALGRLADLGFHTAELTFARPHPIVQDLDRQARRSLAQRLRSLDIRPMTMQPTYTDLNLASPNEGFRRESVQQMKDCIEVAADLEIPNIVTVTGRINALMPLPFEQSLVHLLASIEALLPLAERLGVTLALESTPPAPTPDSTHLLEVLKRVDHPNAGVALDVANSLLFESPTDALRAVRSRLAVVHLSDAKRAQWLHAAVGDGEIDFAAVYDTLVDIGYDGPCILETTVPDAPDDSYRRSLPTLTRLGWQL